MIILADACASASSLLLREFRLMSLLLLQVLLKERSTKDLESTHNCTQVFVVITAQPRGVQVDIGGHTYLVSPGDHFFVPQNCEYRLTNHSSDTQAEIAFVVIKPRLEAAPSPAVK